MIKTLKTLFLNSHLSSCCIPLLCWFFFYLFLLICFLEGQHKVTIDAPKITSLDIVGRVLEVNIIQDLMSLDTAGVQSDFLYYITTESDLFLRGWHAFKFMSGLQNLKSLSLSEKILKVCPLSSFS